MSEKEHKKSEFKPQTTPEVFTDYARYYDLLYRDKDYSKEAAYVASLIRRFHPTASTILELGSGTGIHASLLTQNGFTVHGIERSPEMLARSLITAESIPQGYDRPVFSLGDIRKLRLNKSLDAVIALFHVISYQTTNQSVTEAFENARYHLTPGGIFIFDVWYGPAVLTERPAVRIKRMTDDQVEVTRLAEPVLHPNENRVDVHYHIFVRSKMTRIASELTETHAMRYFFKPEIERIALQAGFHYLHAEEWLSGRGIGCDTWGVCFLLRAV